MVLEKKVLIKKGVFCGLNCNIYTIFKKNLFLLRIVVEAEKAQIKAHLRPRLSKLNV